MFGEGVWFVEVDPILGISADDATGGFSGTFVEIEGHAIALDSSEGGAEVWTIREEVDGAIIGTQVHRVRGEPGVRQVLGPVARITSGATTQRKEHEGETLH
jgi:hypothetical protein